MFRVGDIVTCKPGNPGHYILTLPGRRCRVMRTIDRTSDLYNIVVVILEDKSKEEHVDSSRYFELDKGYAVRQLISELQSEGL